MAVFARVKQVTDPLNERVKACLCGKDCKKTGYVSSGSEHEAEEDIFLSDLVHGFPEPDGYGPHLQDEKQDSDGNASDHDLTDALQAILHQKVEDRFRSKLSSHVCIAAEAFSCLRQNRPAFQRAIVKCLRDAGYNAGICKTKWNSSGGLAAGNYEFMDVVTLDGGRYLIDLDLAGEFEIARPTGQYGRLQMALPQIYVGPPEELKHVVRLVADAAKTSLRRRDLHLPPWRKNRYMQAKWLGHYRRCDCE